MFRFWKDAKKKNKPVSKPAQEFGQRKVCGKCGGKKFSRHFNQYYYGEIMDAEEHIAAECTACGAVYWEKTKEASKRRNIL